jgi:hypothetical protein
MTKPAKVQEEMENRWHHIRRLLESSHERDDVHVWSKPQHLEYTYHDGHKYVTAKHVLHPPVFQGDTKPRLSPEYVNRELGKHFKSLGIKNKFGKTPSIEKVRYVDAPIKESVVGVSGAGDIGTDRLVKKYKKDTPGQ